MPPVLRRPASSNSRGQRRRTQPAAASPVRRRPASSISTGQRRQTQPAAARQTRRSTQQVGSLASSSQAPDGTTTFHFNFGVWLVQVILGRRPIESAPTYKDAREAAKQLKKKIKCSCCGRKTDWKELNFRQWTSIVWTGYCSQCDR